MFFQQLAEGLGAGAGYAALALALVLAYRFTGIVNFAQGELALLATYVAWQLVDSGLPYWAALPVTVAVAFTAGMLTERVLIRRVESAPGPISPVVATIGLYVLVNALAALVWSSALRAFPSPFPDAPAGLAALAAAGLAGLVLGALALVVRHTGLGLVMRAVAADPRTARLSGIRVGQVAALGWGAASAVGALSGVLLAPSLFLEPAMMTGVLVYAFAAAVLGGFDSAPGAVAGGLIVGVTETLCGTYLAFVGADLKIAVPLVLIVAVLLLRPRGLFGTAPVERA
ncbi:branched-chain amino acid ABC transporter permease [Nonomuraea soli]|uniref:Branched-chain amino acid transport system permease protein n=1 Tax=Nonomuraea soli TaxID=1032476 RepID=A0A7W0HPH5_9ACTN|nr:branched-chain amino acid ABC transporter permease [Nonomuraea soli]MBA2890890.1 branched-chain amino acid transport system permease protein [Nonomuraea soli]